MPSSWQARLPISPPPLTTQTPLIATNTWWVYFFFTSSSFFFCFFPFLCLSVFVFVIHALGENLYPQELLFVVEALALYPTPLLLL